MSLDICIRTAASPAMIKRGCVNVVGLDLIKAQAGARWEKMRDAIYARLEILLSSKLGPTDLYFRLGETAYLVITPAHDGDDARLCCLKIAYELHRSLLGKCSLADLSLARVVSEDGKPFELRAFERASLAELAFRGGIEELYREIAVPQGPARRGGETAMAAREPAFCYAPIWDSTHEAITAYRLEVVRGDARRRVLSHTELRAESRAFLAALTHAERTLSAALAAGGRYLMVIQVAYDLIAAPASRMDIVAACRAMAAQLRPFLIFEIASVAVGVPQSRMSDLLCSFRPFCRAVTIELPREALGHPIYRNAGHQGIGVALAPDARDDITSLAAMAKAQNLISFVNGLASPALGERARNAGIQYLSGPLFGPSLHVPRPMTRLPWQSVLRQNPEVPKTVEAAPALSRSA